MSPPAATLPARPASPEYDAADLVRRVRHDGYVSFKGRKAKLSEAFARLDVAFRPTAQDGVWNAYFMRFKVAAIDVRSDETHSQTVRDVS